MEVKDVEKIIIYGLGEGYELSASYLTKTFNVVGFSDRVEAEIEKYVKPCEIHKVQFDYIVVTSNKYYEEIRRELVTDHQVPLHKIVTVNELIASICNARNAMARSTSITDDDIYPFFAQKAAKYEYIFNTFRLSPIIRRIYEHVSKENGWRLIDIIDSNADVKFSSENWERFIKNDQFGDPEKFEYIINNSGGGVNIAPTTLRYVKVLQDILCLYEKENIKTIAEIGIGYGGQCRIVMDYLKNREYSLIDLPEVLGLAKVYLSKFVIPGEIYYVDGTRDMPRKEYDLVISNYAFSELNRDVQNFYLGRVIDTSKAGYITWNSLSFKKLGGYSVKELLDRIPGASVIEEEPLTALDNCVIVWGTAK